jgi:hypothetical protein
MTSEALIRALNMARCVEDYSRLFKQIVDPEWDKVRAESWKKRLTRGPTVFAREERLPQLAESVWRGRKGEKGGRDYPCSLS